MAATKHLLPDLAATEALAARLARFARPGDVIALAGDLGTGKTAFARAFINALARCHGLPDEEVPSPTFTLVQTYEFPPFTLYHIDLYRIDRPEDAYELGIEDAFADGVSLIEWPDRLGALLPRDRLALTFRPGPDADSREVEIEPHGDWSARIEEAALNG